MKRNVIRKFGMLAVAALLIGGITLTSCGSNPNKCSACGKKLTESNRVKATTANGEVYLCHQCYVVGKQCGRCF